MQAHTFHTVNVNISQTDPWVLLVDFGTALWLIAYAIAIVEGFKKKTYSLPLVAICSNFAWEILASFDWVAPIALWHIGAILWMLFDGLIVYQVVRYGRAQQVIPELKQYYYPVLAATFVLAFIGQYTYSAYYDDALGFEDAYVINTTMSILFVFMYFARREAGNSTYAVAWLKMFGTGLTSLAMVFIFPKIYSERTSFGFMHFLYATILLVDLVYVVILTHARRARAA